MFVGSPCEAAWLHFAEFVLAARCERLEFVKSMFFTAA